VVRFDTGQWPLVLVRMEGAVSDAEFQGYLEQLSVVARKGEKWVGLVDLSTCGRTPASQQQMHADWNKAHLDVLRAHCLGTTFVLTSTFARLAVNMVLMMRPIPQPYAVVATAGAGLSWAAERLEAAGMVAAAMRTRAHPMLQPRRAAAGAR
jgi:hypothetical protein